MSGTNPSGVTVNTTTQNGPNQTGPAPNLMGQSNIASQTPRTRLPTREEFFRNSQEVKEISKNIQIINPCCCDCGSWNLRICCLVIVGLELILYIPFFVYVALIQRHSDSFPSLLEGTVMDLLLLWLSLFMLITSILASIILLGGVLSRRHQFCILHSAFTILIVLLQIIVVILAIIKYQKDLSNALGLSLWGIFYTFAYLYFASSSYGLSTMQRVGVDKLIPITASPKRLQLKKVQPPRVTTGVAANTTTTQPIVIAQQPVQPGYTAAQRPVVYAPAYPAYAPQYYGDRGGNSSSLMTAMLMHNYLYGGYGYGPYYGSYGYGHGYYGDHYHDHFHHHGEFGHDHYDEGFGIGEGFDDYGGGGWDDGGGGYDSGYD